MSWGLDGQIKTVRVARNRGIYDALPPDRITSYSRGDELFGYLADSANVIPGTGETRLGTDNYLTSAVSGAVQGIWPHIEQATTTKQLLWAANAKLYRDDGTLIETLSTTADAQVNFAMMKDYTFYVSGNATDSLRQWDGTTAAKVTPNATAGNELDDATSPIHASKYIIEFGNRIFLGGSADLSYRVYPSDLTRVAAAANLPDTFLGTAAMDFHSGRGGGVTGFVKGASVLFVLKSDSVHGVFMATDSSLSQSPVLPALGCKSGRTAHYLPGVGLTFQGEDGHVYALTSDPTTTTRFNALRLTKHITGLIGDINKPYLHTAAAGVTGHYYWLAVPTGAATVPNKVYVCDFSQVSQFADPVTGDVDPTALFVPWGVYTFPAGQAIGSCFAVYANGTTQVFLAGDASTGQIWKLEQTAYNDNGTAISAYLLSAKHHFSLPDWTKTLRDIPVTYAGLSTSSDLTARVYVDDQSPITLETIDMIGNPSLWGSLVWGTDVWGAVEGNRTQRVRANLRGALFQVKLSHSTLDKKMNIYEHGFSYVPMRRL